MQAEDNNDITRPSPQPIGWLIGASVLFHVLMLMVFNQGFTIQAEKKSEKINKITATLIFTPKMLEAELEPEIEPEPEQSPVEEQQPVAKDILKNEIPEYVEAKLPEKETQEIAELDNLEQDIASPTSDPVTDNQKPTADIAPTVVSRDLARQHLNNYSQLRNQQMAQDAARAYRQQQVSPDFPAAKVDPFKTEEEKFQESIQVTADCSSTTNKSVAMVASLFGGNIKCSKPPSFQKFIDKRLNKEEAK